MVSTICSPRSNIIAVPSLRDCLPSPIATGSDKCTVLYCILAGYDAAISFGVLHGPCVNQDVLLWITSRAQLFKASLA